MARKIAIKPASDTNIGSVKETDVSNQSAAAVANNAGGPKPARPCVTKADPKAFAAELLISDRTVMDILSK